MAEDISSKIKGAYPSGRLMCLDQRLELDRSLSSILGMTALDVFPFVAPDVDGIVDRELT